MKNKLSKGAYEYHTTKYMGDKDLEQIVLQGLQYEAIEKEKSAERKALTRKNGLKIEDAKYNDGSSGQTRDIVAERLGVSGKHWERMKYVYYHRDCLLEEDYEKWRIGILSTSKMYSELKSKLNIESEIDNILDALWKLSLNKPSGMRNIHNELEYTLFNYPRVKEKVFSSLADIEHIYNEYSENNSIMVNQIIDDVETLKKKIKIGK